MTRHAEMIAPAGSRIPLLEGQPAPPADSQDVLRFVTELAAQGDVTGYETVCGRVFLVNRPDLIRHVFHSECYERSILISMTLGEGLLTTEGEPWLRRRKMLQPSFRMQQLAAIAPIVSRCTLDMLQRWEAAARAGEPVDVADETIRLTLRIIVNGLFGVDIGSEKSKLPQAFSTIIDFLSRFGFVQFNLPRQITANDRRRYQEAVDLIDDFVYQIIRGRSGQNQQPRDLLSVLLHDCAEPDGALSSRSLKQIRDEMVTLLLAGHETTASAINWTWHLLSIHPEVERRVHGELAAVLGGRVPQGDDLPQLPYLQRVFQESMRVYPPVWFIGRKAVADDVLGGVEVPAGAPIIVCPYTMHRHPEFWESPDRFDPDRFLPERSQGREHYAYVPFAGGRHLCIGNHLAMLEGRLIIATVAQKYRLRGVDGFVVEPEPLFTLRQRGGLPMLAKRR